MRVGVLWHSLRFLRQVVVQLRRINMRGVVSLGGLGVVVMG